MSRREVVEEGSFFQAQTRKQTENRSLAWLAADKDMTIVSLCQQLDHEQTETKTLAPALFAAGEPIEQEEIFSGGNPCSCPCRSSAPPR